MIRRINVQYSQRHPSEVIATRHTDTDGFQVWQVLQKLDQIILLCTHNAVASDWISAQT
jgi:hypothetical protein